MLTAWLCNACCLYSKTAAKASKNQPAIAYENLSTSSPPSQLTATAAAASSGDAIDSGIYLHANDEWQNDSSKNFTGVYEMIDDVPTSSSRPTPLPAAAAAACYNVGTDSDGLNHNQGEPRAINNLQPDDSEKRASNIYHMIDDEVPTTSQSLPPSQPTPLWPQVAPPPAADSLSVDPDSDYSQPRNTSEYMPMSPQHSSSSQPTLLPPSTPETAAVYEEAGVSVDEDNPYVEPIQLFDNDLYFGEVKPSTEVSDGPDGQSH